MLRRTFLLQTTFGGLSLAALGACQNQSPQARAAARQEIEADIQPTITRLYRDIPGSRETANRAVAQLIFPSVLKVGAGIGGEHGNGALRVGGRTTDYYSISGGSIGAVLGAERRSIVIMFLTQEAYKQFHAGDGWTFGAETSVAAPEAGAAASVNSSSKPIVAYLFGNSGLMFNASIEGTKVTRLHLQ